MPQTNSLTEREKAVVELLLQGKSNKQIAFALSITDRTVEFHLTNIYTKLGFGSRAEAISQLGKSTDNAIAEKQGDSTVVEINVLADTQDKDSRLNFQSQEKPTVTRKISLEEIIRFLVTYKIPIFIWILLPAAVVLLIFILYKPPWTYEREGEYPSENTVGRTIQRSNASGSMVYGQFGVVPVWPAHSMVHGQFGVVPAWPLQSGFVKYDNIKTPQTDHLYLKLLYSKHSPASVRILIFIDDDIRFYFTPADQGDWNNFVWSELIDLGSVESGVHSIKFYTDGQDYGVADLDRFVLTNYVLTINPP